MPWTFTLHVTDCADEHKAIQGAVITDLVTGGGTTNDYGDCVLTVLDDTADGWGMDIFHDGYETRNIAVYKNQADTTVNTCLHAPGAAST